MYSCAYKITSTTAKSEISVATEGGGQMGAIAPNQRQTWSWDLRKSDEKHAGRKWRRGAPVVGRYSI